jgi:hypothetical protein
LSKTTKAGLEPWMDVKEKLESQNNTTSSSSGSLLDHFTYLALRALHLLSRE